MSTNRLNLEQISWSGEEGWEGGSEYLTLPHPLAMNHPPVEGQTESQTPLLSDLDQHQGLLYLLLHIIVGEDTGWMTWTIRKTRFLHHRIPHSGGLQGLREVQHIQSNWGKIRKINNNFSSGENLLIPNELLVNSCRDLNLRAFGKLLIYFWQNSEEDWLFIETDE